MSDAREWAPDVLPGFERTTIALPAEDDGPLVATVVRRRVASGSTRAVLYVHGFVDYFFQGHVAEAFLEAGWDFYALDLRRYGRSLRGGNRPNYVVDLAHYDTEIEAALDIVRGEDAHDTVALLGHSTGGLTAALYAGRGARRDEISALILNSPFFAFAVQGIRGRLLPVAAALGAAFPVAFDPKGLAPYYGYSLHADHRGEWQYDLRWKPIRGFPIYWGWARAVRHAQRDVAAGLAIGCPVLLLHSSRSLDGRGPWQDDYTRADIVLDVADMRRVGPGLGRRVTLAEIRDGLHDLYLSAAPARETAIVRTLVWLNGTLPTQTTAAHMLPVPSTPTIAS